MRPYLRPPLTDSHQIWAVVVFYHAPLIHGIQNAEMQKKKKILVTSSLLYFYREQLLDSANILQSVDTLQIIIKYSC